MLVSIIVDVDNEEDIKGYGYVKLIPSKCTCDNDPYTIACDYCLAKRDLKIFKYYKIEGVKNNVSN